MASNITADTKAAIVGASKVIWRLLNNVLGTGGFQELSDDLLGLAGVTALNIPSRTRMGEGVSQHREQLALIKRQGRELMDPILLKAARECSSRVVQNNDTTDWPRLFRDLSADLLGGTPDYFDPRNVSFASNPAVSAKGIFRRLTVDYLGEPIQDGYHNQTKIARILSKPQPYQSIAVIEGQSNDVGDDFDYRAGRLRRSAPMPAINDSKAPTGITNPYLIPSDLTDEADIAAISNWTINTTGTPVFKVERTAANLWRSRAHTARFTGDNTEAIELVQAIPATVLADQFRPWDIGVPIKLESGWQGTIDLTNGGHTQQFTHSDLTAGSFVHLFLTADKDLYPRNFDATGASWKLKFTNSQNNTQSIWAAGFLPQPMTRHEGIWYSHWSDTNEPEGEDTVSWADTADFLGKVLDVIAFLYQDVALGDAHLPTSGATTIADPTYPAEIGLTVSGTPVADGGSVALGSVASGAHSVQLVFSNTGDGPLIIDLPTTANATNATLTNDGMTQGVLLNPGESTTITVEITDGGAGAFTIDLLFANNDSNENPYNVTISGTAT